MTRIPITLTAEEWLEAVTKGGKQQIGAILEDREPGEGLTREESVGPIGWFRNINGAGGERSVSKWLGVPWDPTINLFWRPDVAGLIQVRTVDRHNYPCRLHKKDPDNIPVVLVFGNSESPVWQIIGYILGARGKDPKYWGDSPPPYFPKPGTGRPAYWVPQDDLKENLPLLKERVLAKLAEGTPVLRLVRGSEA